MSAVGTRTPAGTRPGGRARIVVYVVLAVVAVAVAVAGALVQAAWFPGGLLLALAAGLALFYGGVKVSGTRLGAVVPAAVWIVCVMLLSTSRPEGDFLFAAGVGPYIYLLGGAMGAVICATVPQLPPTGPKRF
jgi:peptidoglycan/LPS O-acetylase OafA/YrhL